jgi:hypothetical protein
MKTKRQPQRDPIAAYQREVIAERRSAGKECACGESRPVALIPGSDPTICAKCDRERKGENPMDEHHVPGQANSPETVPTPVNDANHSNMVNTVEKRSESRGLPVLRRC